MESKINFIPFSINRNDNTPPTFVNVNEYEGVESIKKINCFIGSNNSGKSRLIRHLYKVLKYQKPNNAIDVSAFDEAYHGEQWNALYIIHYFKRDFLPFHEAIAYLLDISNYTNNRNHILYQYANELLKYKGIIADNLEKLFTTYYSLLEQSYNVNKIGHQNWRCIRNIVHNPIPLERYDLVFTRNLNLQIDQLYNSVYYFLFKDFNISKLYIPTLRGMRTLANNVDYYSKRTFDDYKIPENKIFTGLSIYNSLQDYLLGNYNQRQLVKAFEDFLSKSFFDNLPVSLIPYRQSDVVYIRVGEKEHPIYNLGDGVQALILLTFPLFLQKDNELVVFIEEPEIHLHPKWQRFFLETIAEYFPKHYFFFTTHSNVLMNWHSSNIYYVKEGTNHTEIQRIETQHSEILENLGYQASDLLSANYIIWVEGISDKIYLKQFIKAYDKDLIEGIHYTIMMYGGCAQLRHFAIEDGESYKIRIDHISKNFGFCIDSDATKAKGFNLEKEKKNFKQACNDAEKFCWVTEVRETENLIPLDIWNEAAVTYAKTIKQHSTKNIPLTDVIYEEDDQYGDRMKTKVKVPKQKTVSVNDKIKMAQQVVKIFPKDITDLQKTPELFKRIEELVAEIKERNLL